MLEDFTAATFSGRIGQVFRVLADAAPLDLELLAAREAPRGVDDVAGGVRTPFSIVFRGPFEPVLPQRIYKFEKEDLGTFEIFIVPIGPDETGMQYEAVFG